MRLAQLSILLLFATGCSSDGSTPPPAGAWDCEELPLAVVDVSGIYRFSGEGIYSMLGTITFEQTGTTVRVVGTHYDNTDDRELEGEGTIVGNKLEITLVPINGDLDYSADVTLVFSPDGEEFCCAFADTNDDTGPMGSYRGVREAPLPPPWDCEELPLAVVDVTGVYRFSGEGIYSMLGTITFEQTGTTVRVVGTHYDNTDDRELEGEGTIVGNKLEITLVPINGDLDYSADVTLVFSPDGERFCCAFADTNDDTGPMGSYLGVRE